MGTIKWYEFGTKFRGKKHFIFLARIKPVKGNFIYVSAKYYIYANKFSEKSLNLDVYKAILRRKFQGEHYSAHY